ncbi:MAG: hypothetical protein RR142_10820 [Clostridia bacterium]
MTKIQTIPKASALSAALCNASMLLYPFWLLLPAVQTTGRALTGMLAVGLFGLGVLLDTAYLKRQWAWFLLRVACAATLPLLLWFFMGRGGQNLAGFYVQQSMFWFPLIFCAYAKERGDERLWRFVKLVLLATVALTTLTTIGWLVQGMLRGGRVYAYSRSLGFAEPGNEAYLKELMLRNIGGYDFIYASVVSLPFTCMGIMHHKGLARAGFFALLAAQLVMIVLSQYTYAMVFAACITAVELFAWLIRVLSRGRTGMGASLLWGLTPLLLVLVLRVPLITLAAGLCERVGFTSFAFSLNQLLVAMAGGVTDEASRLGYYLLPLRGIAASPLVGSMFGGEALLSRHSDLLDLLSGMGLLGASAVGAMLWLMGRGSLYGVKQCPYKAQLAVAALALTAIAALGTVVYSRDILLVGALGMFFATCSPPPHFACEPASEAQPR